MNDDAPFLSIVVPVHNESENVGPLIDEIVAAMGGFQAFEIIYVDDGSTDGTPDVLAVRAAADPRLRVIRHQACAGQSAALRSGVAAARAEWVATLDGDGQNDPGDIPALWNELQKHETRDATVLQGWRRRRRDSFLRRISSRVANGVRASLLKDSTPDVGCGLKLFRRDVYLSLPFFDHMHRFLPALFQRAGQTVVSIPVTHRPRLKGRSHYGLHNRLWVGITDLLGVMWLTRRMVYPRIAAASRSPGAVPPGPVAPGSRNLIPPSGPDAPASAEGRASVTPRTPAAANAGASAPAEADGVPASTAFLVITGWAILTGIGLATRPLLPIDETRYLSVAWEMWLRHDWLVPHLNGAPYSDKPPLLFWLILAGWKLFGVNSIWPRLVGPIISLFALFVTARLSLRLWAARKGLPSSAMLIGLGTILWLIYGGLVLFDSLLALCVAVGMLGLVRAASGRGQLRQTSRYTGRLSGWALFAIAIGAGILAKGPVALMHLLPAFLLAPWWAAQKAGDDGSTVPPGGRSSGFSPLTWYAVGAAAITAGVAIALAWALPAAARGGHDYTQQIFLSQTSGRIVKAFAHKRPFWWYLPLLPLLFGPWFFMPRFWRGLWPVLRRRVAADAGTRFCIAWLVPVLIGFSLISGKQMHYLFPLVPAFALLAARLMAGSPEGMPDSDHAAAIAASHYPVRLLKVVTVVTLIAFAATEAIAFHFVGPRYDLNPVAQHLKEIETGGRPIAHIGKYSGQYHFLGRLEKPFQVIAPSEAASWLNDHPEGAIVNYTHQTPARLGDGPDPFVQQYQNEFVVVSSGAARPGPN